MNLPASVKSYWVVLFVTAIVGNVVEGRINDPKKGQYAKITLPGVNVAELFRDEGYQKRLPRKYEAGQKETWLTPEDERVRLGVELPDRVRLKGGHLLCSAIEAKLPNGGVVLAKQD
jgi:hypothetical protein